MKSKNKFSATIAASIPFGLVFVLAMALLLPQALAVSVIMQHNDLSRTGANTSEVILSPANVNTSNFGKLFTDSVDGQIYAQPLYVQNLTLSGGTHNVVFVCTESNSVYAFDADSGGITYWHDKLGTPFTPSCSDLSPVVGITGTPVIDPDSDTLYVDTKLVANSATNQELHALDITTGAEKFGGPVIITGGSEFNPILEHQRPGLVLYNGVVYVAFGSHCDQGAYHGFVFGYNATNLTRMYSFNTTPTGSQGAIWSGGMAPPVDTNGNIYVMTGNGSFDGITNYGESMIKLSSNLVVQSYATPTNWSSLNSGDTDFGSGGPVLLPTHYVVGMGKDGVLSLADIDNMGGVGGFVQSFSAQSKGDTLGKSPVYWQGPSMQYLFFMHANSTTKSFQFTGTNVNTTPLGTASSFTESDRSGGLSLSANGATNGILWEIDSDSNLRAYDAVNFPKLLWSGSVGSYVKMNCPTIANGKVYVGTMNSLGVWGLTNFLYLQSGIQNPVLNWGNGKLLQATNLTGPWTTNTTATSPFTVFPTNGQTFYRLFFSGP